MTMLIPDCPTDSVERVLIYEDRLERAIGLLETFIENRNRMARLRPPTGDDKEWCATWMVVREILMNIRQDEETLKGETEEDLLKSLIVRLEDAKKKSLQDVQS